MKQGEFFPPFRSVVWTILLDTMVLEALEILSFRGRQEEAACSADSGKSAEADKAPGCSNPIEAHPLVGVRLRQQEMVDREEMEGVFGSGGRYDRPVQISLVVLSQSLYYCRRSVIGNG